MNTDIFIENLRETHDNGFEALKGISLEVEQVDFFALLGPNNAATNWPGFGIFAPGWRDIQSINFFANRAGAFRPLICGTFDLAFMISFDLCITALLKKIYSSIT